MKVKSSTCFAIGIGMMCIGAFIINEGFGLIVWGAFWIIGSYVKYTEEEETEEEAKVPRDLWHPTCQVPDRDADIIFRNSKNRLFEPVKFYVKSLNVYSSDGVEPYSWGRYCDAFVFDEWAYIDELI